MQIISLIERKVRMEQYSGMAGCAAVLLISFFALYPGFTLLWATGVWKMDAIQAIAFIVSTIGVIVHIARHAREWGAKKTRRTVIALTVLTLIIGWAGIDRQIQRVHYYRMAMIYIRNQNYVTARETLGKIPDYSDSRKYDGLYWMCDAHVEYFHGDFEDASISAQIALREMPSWRGLEAEQQAMRDIVAMQEDIAQARAQREAEYRRLHPPTPTPKPRPTPTPTPRPIRRSKPKPTSYSDPYNVNDYYDAEDFYDDYYDDFYDYEDAEDYFDTHRVWN